MPHLPSCLLHHPASPYHARQLSQTPPCHVPAQLTCKQAPLSQSLRSKLPLANRRPLRPQRPKSPFITTQPQPTSNRKSPLTYTAHLAVLAIDPTLASTEKPFASANYSWHPDLPSRKGELTVIPTLPTSLSMAAPSMRGPMTLLIRDTATAARLRMERKASYLGSRATARFGCAGDRVGVWKLRHLGRGGLSAFWINQLVGSLVNRWRVGGLLVLEYQRDVLVPFLWLAVCFRWICRSTSCNVTLREL